MKEEHPLSGMKGLYTASRMSSTLEPMWTGRRRGAVCGVYRRCFNFLTEDGILATVFSRTGPMTTTALVTDFPPETAFSGCGIEDGMAVAVEAGVVDLIGMGMRFDFSRAEAVDLQRMPFRETPTREAIHGNMASLAEVVRREGRTTGGGAEANGDLARKIRTGMSGLASAIVRGDVREIDAGLGRVIGLGIGLTPTCDDMTVGLAAWLHLFPGGAGRWNGFFAALRAFLEREGAGRTTLVSRTMLLHAASGILSDPLYGLVGALIGRADPGGIPAAARSMLAYGHGSGADTCMGILMGYEIMPGPCPGGEADRIG